MKLLFLYCLMGLAISNPVQDSQVNNSKSINTKSDDEKYVIYTAEYNIVDILLPLNELNRNTPYRTLFFVLADFKNGERIDKGLYVLKNREVNKILDNGRHATADIGGLTNTAYFAASDGIYYYNDKETKAEKYGTLDDDIISIEKINGTNEFYILTKDHIVYKVLEKGTKKYKIIEIDNAEQLVMDYKYHLYYVGNNALYTYNSGKVKKIEGLPKTWEKVKLIRPPVILEDGVGVFVDNKVYIAFANGTSRFVDNSKKQPTAASFESMFLLYIGIDKKIYEINILDLIFRSDAVGLKSSFWIIILCFMFITLY